MTPWNGRSVTPLEKKSSFAGRRWSPAESAANERRTGCAAVIIHEQVVKLEINLILGKYI